MSKRSAIRIAAVLAVALLAVVLGGRYYAWVAYRTPDEPFAVAAGLGRLGVLGPASLPEIWGERFPRPFVTDVLLLLAFSSVAALIRDGGVTAAARAWAIAGAALGLLVHGEIFGLAPLGILTA